MRSRNDSKKFAESCRVSILEGITRLKDDDPEVKKPYYTLENIEKNKSFTDLVKESDLLVQDVKYSILSQSTPQERAKMVEFFVDVVRESVQSENYFTAGTVLGSLTSTEIKNLPVTQHTISDKDRDFLDDLAYFLGSGKALAESEASKNEGDLKAIPNLAALKSLYIAYNEAINQNVGNIFKNWLKADSNSKNEVKPILDIQTLLSKDNLLQVIGNAKDMSEDPVDIRKVVIEEIGAKFLEYLEAYKLLYPTRQPKPTPDELKKMAEIDYTRDIKGKIIKIIDAAFSLREVSQYVGKLKNSANGFQLNSPDVDKYSPNSEATAASIEELYLKYKDEEKSAIKEGRISVKSRTRSNPGEEAVANLEVVSTQRKIEFLESKLKAKEKVLDDSLMGNPTGKPSEADKKNIKEIKELTKLISNVKKRDSSYRLSQSSQQTPSQFRRVFTGLNRGSGPLSRRGSSVIESSPSSLRNSRSSVSGSVRSSRSGSSASSSVIEATDLDAKGRMERVLKHLDLQKAPGFIAAKIREENWNEATTPADLASRDILVGLLDAKQANLVKEKTTEYRVTPKMIPKNQGAHEQIDIGIDAAKVAYARRHGVEIERSVSRSNSNLTEHSQGAALQEVRRPRSNAKPVQPDRAKLTAERPESTSPEVKQSGVRIGVKALAARKAPPAAPSPLNKEISDSITVLGEDFDSKAAKDVLTKIKNSDLSDNAKRQFYSKLHQVAKRAGDTSGLIGVLNAYIARNNTNLLVATTLQADPRKVYAPKANEEAAISAAKVDKPGVEPQPVRQSSKLVESANNEHSVPNRFKKK